MSQLKFDRDEARQLRAAGLSYAAIGARLGVSQAAIARVLNPTTRQKEREANRSYYRKRPCHYCGGECSWNPHSKRGHPVPRCRKCASDQKRTTVRSDTLKCLRCGEWKPDDDFPHSSYNVRRRGRHSFCRPCGTLARQEYRVKVKVPCALCGQPALPFTEKGANGSRSVVPICLSCERTRRREARALRRGSQTVLR